MALKSTSKQMCVYIFIVNTYEVGHLYLTIRTEWIFFFFNLFFSMRIVNVIATHRPPVIISNQLKTAFNTMRE